MSIWITTTFVPTSISTEEPVLGLECGAHKIPRRLPSEIASWSPDWFFALGRALCFRVGGFRPAANESAHAFGRESCHNLCGSTFCKSHRKSPRPDHHGSVWRFSVPGVPRLF